MVDGGARLAAAGAERERKAVGRGNYGLNMDPTAMVVCKNLRKVEKEIVQDIKDSRLPGGILASQSHMEL